MTVARSTQQAVETLTNVVANVRPTQLVVEELSANSLKAMVTQTVVEELSSNALFAMVTQTAIEALSPLTPPDQTIYPTSIDSGEAFGTPTILSHFMVVTQEVVEALSTVNSNLQVTQEAVEALSTVNPNLQVTQETIETLSMNSLQAMVTQAVVEELSANALYMMVSQAVIEVLALSVPPDQTIYPTSIDSGEAFGTPLIINVPSSTGLGIPQQNTHIAPIEILHDYVQLPLPALSDRAIAFDVSVYGTRYYVDLTWNVRLTGWYATIRTDSETIAVGRRVEINIPILAKDTTRQRPIGDFILVGPTNNDPGEDLTDHALLYYQTKNAPIELPVEELPTTEPTVVARNYAELILPSPGELAHSFDAIIDEVRYYFDVVYRARLDGWYLTVSTDTEIIATGRRMIVGTPLLMTDIVRSMPGNLILIDLVGSSEPSSDLSHYALLYYV